MLTNLILNALAGLIALSISSGVALHDSRFDKVFATFSSPADTSQHDVGSNLNHSVGHDLHVHTLDSATHSDPGAKARTHRRHTALHHVRFKLATLYA